jgi:tetratricopeptide (TPR) repeat protein/predicted small secreted protein
MKKLRFLTALIIALAALASCATTGGSGDGFSLAEAVEQSAEKIAADLPSGSRVAIVAWESASAGLSDYIMEELTGALVDRNMEVADRQNLEYVYRELDFQMSGEVDDESARSIGKFLGADLVITGQLTELGGPYRYRANAIHVENATRNSATRLDVRGDAAMRRMAAALANQKPAVKTASYGEAQGEAAPKTAVPQTAGTFLDRGITLASQGEFEMAIEDFTEALTLNPNLGSAYMLRGRARRASVTNVTDMGENFSCILSNTGGQITEAQKRVYEQAIADFTEAIRLDPGNAVAYRERGAVYALRGDTDKGIADHNQAIRLNPQYAFAYYNRGVAYADKKDYDRAIADYNQVIRLDPNFTAVYSSRGNAYNNKGDYDRAIADYTQAIRLDPNYTAAYSNRGLAYNNKGDYDQAIADYTQAIRLDPIFALAYNNRGFAYYNKRDYDQAIADYTQAIRLDPIFALAYGNRGVAYHNKRDYDRAIADYEAVLRIDPNNTLAKSNLEIARRARGR